MGTSSRFSMKGWLRSRELGDKAATGYNDRIATTLYSSVRHVRSWNPKEEVKDTHHGGVFNFDFATDGSMLVAACEKQSFLLFDPLNGKLISARNNAHSDCVNCVRFLDYRMFATCSDDTTVCLWDTRYLKHKVRTLRGHANWVKNIEYSRSAEKLVTSGFDGSIFAWDINRYTESDCSNSRLFHTNGLMRTKLTPDASKLIIATAGGYLMVIHDLDLSTLQEDLQGFKPNMYRLMQMSQQPIRQGYKYNSVFHRKRNKVELISDFPEGNDAEMIASLEVHPQGWCVVSRNTSSDESSEWTCIHDIQGNSVTKPQDDDDDDISADSQRTHEVIPSQCDSDVAIPAPGRPPQPKTSNGFNSECISDSNAIVTGVRQGNQHSTSAVVPEENSFNHQLTDDDNNHSGNEWQQLPQMPSTSRHEHMAHSLTLGESVTFIIRSGSQVAERTLLLLDQKKPANTEQLHIHSNKPRLTHYIQEPNIGRGFIKEVNFSSDGRLICSPFGFGVRLLTFGPQCQELSDVCSDRPLQMHELTSNMSHVSPVVTTKFSPSHCLLVTGCLNGKVDFHQPVL